MDPVAQMNVGSVFVSTQSEYGALKIATSVLANAAMVDALERYLIGLT